MRRYTDPAIGSPTRVSLDWCVGLRVGSATPGPQAE